MKVITEYDDLGELDREQIAELDAWLQADSYTSLREWGMDSDYNWCDMAGEWSYRTGRINRWTGPEEIVVNLAECAYFAMEAERECLAMEGS